MGVLSKWAAGSQTVWKAFLVIRLPHREPLVKDLTRIDLNRVCIRFDFTGCTCKVLSGENMLPGSPARAACLSAET